LNIATVDGIGSFKYDVVILESFTSDVTTEIIKSNRLGGLLPSFESFFQIMLDKQNEKLF
jgi:hypothetical protein